MRADQAVGGRGQIPDLVATLSAMGTIRYWVGGFLVLHNGEMLLQGWKGHAPLLRTVYRVRHTQYSTLIRYLGLTPDGVSQKWISGAMCQLEPFGIFLVAGLETGTRSSPAKWIY